MTWRAEDFVAGRRLRTAPRTVSAADVALFASLTGDHHPLHTDPAYAATTEFGAPIAHGLLGLSTAAGLLHQAGLLDSAVVALLGIRDWQFRAPIRPGDALVAVAMVDAVRPSMRRPGQAVATISIELLGEDGLVRQRGAITVLIQ
jgi:acyl dehydratase